VSYLLDTNTVSELTKEKPDPAVVEWIRYYHRDCFLSAVAIGGTYRLFKVPEVWLWRRNKLEVFVLNAAGTYDAARTSRLLPGLDIALVERCVAMTSWQQARRAFRAAISGK